MTRMVRTMSRLVLLLPIVLVVGCARSPGRSPAPTADLDYPVGSFALTERSGKTVTDADLRGKVWVASFVFTRCTGPCPQVTATVARLQNELKDRADVRFVTFTVDPEHDRPEVLARYAANFNADADRWLFLTGDQEKIYSLLRE